MNNLLEPFNIFLTRPDQFNFFFFISLASKNINLAGNTITVFKHYVLMRAH